MKRRLCRGAFQAVGPLALCLTGLGQTAHPGWPNVNLVKNAGFEYKHSTGPDGDIPLYWEAVPFTGGFGSFAIGTSPASVRHGTNALEITDASSAAAWGLRSDDIPVEPGYVYTLRAWYRNFGGTGNVVALRWYDAGHGLLASSATTASDSEWTPLSVTDTAPVGAAFASVLLYSDVESTGTASFDSISLVLAEQRVGDGGFGQALPGQLPDHWTVSGSHAGSVQEAAFDGVRWIRPVQVPGGGVPDWGGNLTLKLVDVSALEGCGASTRVPVTGDTPYELSARVRKPNGVGEAELRLTFHDAAGVELSTHSRSTSSPSFTTLGVEATADPGAVYGELECASPAAALGESRFDDVRFMEDYTVMYASSSGAGAMDGTSPANAAHYAGSNLWNAVNAGAASHPVKVVLLAGDYEDYLELSGVGNAAHHVLIEGETPFAVNMSGSTSQWDYVWVFDSRNLLIRHLHFTSDDTAETHYLLRIGKSGVATHDIRVQGCSFVDVPNMDDGITGAHRPLTHAVTWEYSSWVRVGYDAPDHCIYNAWGAYDLWIHDDYFQDCGGAYVKNRDECHDVLVEDCTFLSTGTFGEFPNIYMVYNSALNIMGYDELLPYDVTVRNSSFTYENPNAPGWKKPFTIKMEGDEPSEHPGYYMISTADGEAIADTSNPPERRNALIEENCHIDIMGGDYEVYGNTYLNCDDTLFWFWRKEPPPGDYWVGVCDIDALLGI